MEQVRKKIKDMTVEECKEYNKLQRRDLRQREKQEREARRIPQAEELIGMRWLPEAQQKALDQYVNNFIQTVKSELPDHKFLLQDEYAVEAIASVMCGLENQFLQKVYFGTSLAMLVGNSFPDSAASTAVEEVHRFPQLLQSKTFQDLYFRFLRAVMSWHGQTHGAYSTPEFIDDVKAELAGTYTLSIPKPETALVVPTPAAPIVSDVAAECRVLLQKKVQAVEQFGVPADAVRYLNGDQR